MNVINFESGISNTRSFVYNSTIFSFLLESVYIQDRK